MMHSVPRPGIYGLVQHDGELLRWRYRGRDSKRTWPIWEGLAVPVGSTPRGGNFLTTGWVLATATTAEIRDVPLGVPRVGWRPVWFGEDRRHPWLDYRDILHGEIDTRTWWAREPIARVAIRPLVPLDQVRVRSRARRPPATRLRPLYMPAMSRDALIALVRDLEARANAGAKQVNRKPVGEWVRRTWDVIERRERGETFGVLP